MEAQINTGAQLFGGSSGRWATTMLKEAMRAGKEFGVGALRTLDTLRHEEWKFIDDAVVEETVIRLVGVADLIGRGLTRPVPNALGQTVFGYEKVSDLSPASTTLDGTNRTSADTQEFDFSQLPLPITHKDFSLNLRRLTASRNRGESLDTMQARVAARTVAEQLEKMLFQGGPTFGAMPIYGYTTEPSRNNSGFGTNGDWGQAAKTGENILVDVQTMKAALRADGFYGPYMVYVPADADVKLDGDFKANSDKTIRQRVLEIEGIAGVRVADQLPVSNVVMVQMSQDVTSWVQGQDPQTVQWDDNGGFTVNFKVFAIGVPLVRSTLSGKSGIYHMFD